MENRNTEFKYVLSVIEKEIEGLQAVCNTLTEDFIDAVDLLYSKKGHVIVSGMGKPGHIGRKIAATLASTGTPAFFLHPAEASHGDLGTISDNDILLVLSLSGNTSELIPLLSYANRFGINIVGITGNKDSILFKSATKNILLPKIDEACPHNLAPTTSTTMMLAIGDAIALCLLKRKEFKREQFKNLHPGGNLGKRLLMVKDLMHTDVPKVLENTNMKDVLIEMTSKAFGCACVISKEGYILGVITDGDLRRNMNENFLNAKASEIMSLNPKIVSKEMFVQEATKIMNQLKITNLFVVENGIPCGIIHIHDCLRAGLV